jgi:hypothetical protein
MLFFFQLPDNTSHLCHSHPPIWKVYQGVTELPEIHHRTPFQVLVHDPLELFRSASQMVPPYPVRTTFLLRGQLQPAANSQNTMVK